MARSKGGLQKNIRSIFKDAAMPDDIHVQPIPEEPVAVSAPVTVSEPKESFMPEVPPVETLSESIPTIPVADNQPEPNPSTEVSVFSDPQIEAQMKKQKCEKGFSCYESGLKELCNARVINKGKAVQCLESKKTPCAFRISTFFKRICQCPIRIRIAKKHGK